MRPSNEYERDISYYADKMSSTKRLIERTEALLVEAKEKQKILESLREEVKAIENGMIQAQPELSAISSYLEKVIINKAPYDHGEFGAFSDEMKTYAEKYEELYNEIIEMHSDIEKTISGYNQTLSRCKEDYNKYKSSYENAKKNYQTPSGNGDSEAKDEVPQKSQGTSANSSPTTGKQNFSRAEVLE